MTISVCPVVIRLVSEAIAEMIKWLENSGRFEKLREAGSNNPVLVLCQNDFMVPSHDETADTVDGKQNSDYLNMRVTLPS